MLCAYKLSLSGVNYILIEADKVGTGTTEKTTAKVTSQHGLIYSKIIKEFGVEEARNYLLFNEAAIQQYRDICKKIGCSFEEEDSYVYSVDSLKKLETEMKALQKINCKAEFLKDIKLPFYTSGAIKFKNQLQLDPKEFISKIKTNLNIIEDTKAISYNGKAIITDKGEIEAKKIIVATHFPFINKHGSYYLKMYQHRSYVLALQNAEFPDGMYIDENMSGLTFRKLNDLLLLGGGSHRTGKQGGGYRELEVVAAKYFSNAKIKYKWATQDCMTLDGIPYIGQYSSNTKNLYVATGFNKWGFTSSMIASDILRDMVMGKENSYSYLFSPSRTIFRSQLFINGLETASNLLRLTKPRCPHLGCALKWNGQENSWDCACHGSRFSETGKLINNPATDDLKM